MLTAVNVHMKVIKFQWKSPLREDWGLKLKPWNILELLEKIKGRPVFDCSLCFCTQDSCRASLSAFLSPSIAAEPLRPQVSQSAVWIWVNSWPLGENIPEGYGTRTQLHAQG